MSDADRLHPFTPDCQVRVLTEMCATCIFRPGNLMHLRRGRLATIVNDHQQADGNLICHSTLPYFGDGVEPALCRGPRRPVRARSAPADGGQPRHRHPGRCPTRPEGSTVRIALPPLHPGAITVGDAVRVFDVNRRSVQPAGGWPGVVEKVGRRLVRISYNRTVEPFRLDTRSVNDNYGHRHFETLAEVGARTRMHTAVEFLARHGVTLEPRHRLTVEQVEAMVLALDDTLDQGQETNG
jgi:hypothetical protein